MLLEGKNAIVTGARRGIGFATVKAFAREGANIWACVRKHDGDFEQRLSAIAEEHGVAITPLYFDMLDEAGMKEAVKAIRSCKVPVDVLVNNAGFMATPASFAMTSLSQFREVFDVNFFAQVTFTQYILRIMDRQGSGSIVNLSSIAGLDGGIGQVEYGATKAAMALVTRKLAAEYGSKGIRVNAVAPGIIDTDMNGIVPAEASAKLIDTSALCRIGKPEEVANVIAFLASDLSSYVTGQVIRIDGGVGLAPDRPTRD